MKAKLIVAGLATFLAGLPAQAESNFSINISNFTLSPTGFFRPVSLKGSFSASVQDQVGWTSHGVAEWGPLLSTTAAFTEPGVSITSPAGVHAEVLKTQSFSVSTPEAGGFAMATQDYEMGFLLGAKSSVTVSWNYALSGSQMGLGTVVFETLGSATLGDQVSNFPFSETHVGSANVGWGITTSPALRSITFTNNSDSTIVSKYQSHFSISVRDTVPAVPEPEMAWLALAGVALVIRQVNKRRAQH